MAPEPETAPALMSTSSSSSQPSEPSQKSQPEPTALDQHISALSSARETLTTELAALTSQRNTLLKTVVSEYDMRSVIPGERKRKTSSIKEKEDLDFSDDEIEYGLSLAREVKADHVRELQKYNEIKDIAQGLIGLIAEQRGVRVVDVMKEIGAEDLGS